MKRLFLTDAATGNIRLTSEAIDLYSVRFGKLGFDLRKISTKQQFLDAYNAVFEYEMKVLASGKAGKNEVLKKVLSGLPGWS